MLKLDESQRDKIAKQICAEIRESEREKERLRDRWIRLREIHDCVETSQVQLIEGMKPYVLPSSRAKSDRISGAVVDGITGVTPYVQVFDEGERNSSLDDVELDLMVLASDAGDENAIRTGTEDSLLTNTGVWRVRPFIDERPYDTPGDEDSTAKVTRLDWEAIDPIDVCCYPPTFGTFAAAKTVGHRWSELLYRVKAAMDDGRYFKEEIKGGDDPDRLHHSRDSRTEQYEAQALSDEIVELWEVITELAIQENGRYKRYLCQVALTDEKLLSIQEYPYSTPWYIEVRTETTRGKIFPDSSLMQRLQSLQNAKSDAFTAMIQASYASIGPITILTGGGMMSKISQAKPFMLIEAPEDVKVTSIQTRPEVGALPASLDVIDQTVDGLTGISRTGQSQETAIRRTATEIDGLLQAQSEAKDQYTQFVAKSVERVFRLLFEYYTKHFNELKAAYGNRLVCSPDLVKSLRPTFKVNGQGGANNPNLLLQKLQAFMGVLGQVPGNPYDMVKVLDQFAQALKFPFSIDRLKRDDAPLFELLQMHPEILQLLMTGTDLPAILETIQAHAKSQQPNGQGTVQNPAMGPGAGGNPTPDGGTEPPMLGAG